MFVPIVGHREFQVYQTPFVSAPLVHGAVQAQFGSLTVSQYNEYSRVWWVVLQSEPAYRQHPADLTRLYARSGDGGMVPLRKCAILKASKSITTIEEILRVTKNEEI